MPQSHPQKHLILYGTSLTIFSILILGWMLSSPSEPGSAVLLGFSSARLFLAFGLVTALIFFSWLTVRFAKDQAWAEKTFEAWFGSGRFRHVTGWLGGISFGLGWTVFSIPTHYFGKFEGYLIRLQPVILFILLAGIATLIVLYVNHKRVSIRDVIYLPVFRRGVVIFLVCTPVLIFMLYSKFGLYSLDDFWYGAGVPILVPQLFAAIIGGLFFFQVEKKNFKRLDLLAFILLFAVTAFLWVREPLQKSFMLIGPYAPNQALYPFADAATFDIGSQFSLIGQRIFIKNSYFFERPLYLSFLVYLHTFFAQDYQILMAAQAGIFAVFPALIYLIGRSLNLRSVGVAAALIAMFRGINSIAASNMIDMANPKMMLTDFPAAIGVALVVLATCEWLKAPAKNYRFALWLGGALGFTLMLRTNALILLVLIPIHAFFKMAPNWKKWVLNFFLIFVAIVAITLPWELRNRSLGGQMYGPIIGKFKAVIDTRYRAPSEPSGFIIPNIITLQNTRVLSTLYIGDAQPVPDCSSVACFVPNHFLHNIVTSILIIPTSPIMDNLRHTVEGNPYWSPVWDGVFTPWALFLFTLNLFLVLLGISIAWHRGHLHGITPLAIFMFYNLSNAFARTSGGRYIVPMDWIITIYFLLGVFQVVFWFANTLGAEWKFETVPNPQSTKDNTFTPADLLTSTMIVLVIAGFGTLIPLSEKFRPERYQDFSVNSILAENQQALMQAGLDSQSIKLFRENDDAAVLVGRALYPRYYRKDEGEPLFYPTLNMPFPRTTFTLIGPKGEHGIILPGAVPKYFPNASDVLVIGCKGEDYFDALAVIILDEDGSVYSRSPQSELQCPLQQPICDNNSNCK